MPKVNNLTTRGYLIAIIGVSVWSTTAIFIRYLNDAFNMPPMVIAFWRDLLVAFTLFLSFLLFNRNLLWLERSHYRFIIGFGITLSIFNMIWTISVKMNGAAVSTVLIYSSAAFTALYERFAMGGSFGWRKTLAIILSLLGCVLVAGVYDPILWSLNPWGILVGLFSGICFSAYSIFGKISVARGINSWTALLYSFTLAALILFLLNFIPDPTVNLPVLKRIFWLQNSVQGWIVLIFLAIGPSIGGYGLYNVSLNYLSASVANLIATLEPSMTAVLAFVLLGEQLTVAQISGSLLILAGVVILRLRERIVPKKVTPELASR